MRKISFRLEIVDLLSLSARQCSARRCIVGYDHFLLRLRKHGGDETVMLQDGFHRKMVGIQDVLEQLFWRYVQRRSNRVCG